MRFKVGMLALALTGLLGTGAHSVQAENLLDIYNEAYQRDPVVLQAKANRDRAVSAIDEATAALLPQINLAGGLNYSRINPAGDSSSYNGLTVISPPRLLLSKSWSMLTPYSS